jgi:hypothetical protein
MDKFYIDQEYKIYNEKDDDDDKINNEKDDDDDKKIEIKIKESKEKIENHLMKIFNNTKDNKKLIMKYITLNEKYLKKEKFKNIINELILNIEKEKENIFIYEKECEYVFYYCKSNLYHIQKKQKILNDFN